MRINTHSKKVKKKNGVCLDDEILIEVANMTDDEKRDLIEMLKSLIDK